jgi:hypothetical protein
MRDHVRQGISKSEHRSIIAVRASKTAFELIGVEEQQQHRFYTDPNALTRSPPFTRTEYPAKGPTLKLLLPARAPPKTHHRRARPDAIVGSPFVLQRQSDVQE